MTRLAIALIVLCFCAPATAATFNVKRYKSMAITDNAAAQMAIDACVNAGGGKVLFLAGTYTGMNLHLAMKSPTANCMLVGEGRGSTWLQGVNSSTDILTIGKNSAEAADNIVVQDIGFVGGRYGVRLNNTLHASLSRLNIYSSQTGIYAEGENEGLELDDINVDAASGPSGGMYFGAVNGGAGSVLDYPEIQKSRFRHLRIAHVTGGSALMLAAGILVNQQVSGDIQIDGLLLESNHKDGVALSYCGLGVGISHLNNEDQLDADGVYTTLSSYESRLVLRDSNLSTQATARPKISLDVHEGQLVVENTVIANGTFAGVQLFNVMGSIRDSYESGASANWLNLLQPPTSRTQLENIFDSAGQGIN